MIPIISRGFGPAQRLGSVLHGDVVVPAEAKPTGLPDPFTQRARAVDVQVCGQAKAGFEVVHSLYRAGA